MSLGSLFDAYGVVGTPSRGKMRAVEITQSHEIIITETEIPEVGANDILVKPVACGICGTDLLILKHGFPGTVYPVTPGHEFAGHVVSVGSEVRGIKEGDFVAVDPNVVCGRCKWCLSGRPNLCLERAPIGVRKPGAAADFVVAPAQNAFVVRETLGGGIAALIEPLACVMHAIDSAQGVRDRNVLVLGGGTMGLLIAIVAQTSGAGRVTLADPVSAKHAVARRAGIQDVVEPDVLGSDFFDVVFEAAGAPSALNQALTLVEKTGTLVQVGAHDQHATARFVPFKIYEHEIKIVGSNSCADKFSAAVEIMPDIQDRAAVLLGEPFSVWDFGSAVNSMIAGNAVKTQLRFP